MPKEFYKLTPAEYNLLIGAGLKQKESRLKEYLDLATFISSLVLNDKAEDTYKKIHDSINFSPKEVETKKNDIKHFIELLKKRGKKLPKGYE